MKCQYCKCVFEEDPTSPYCPECGKPYRDVIDDNRAAGADAFRPSLEVEDDELGVQLDDVYFEEQIPALQAKKNDRSKSSEPQQKLTEPSADQICDWYEKKQNIIVVIGFETSGKSFFINRLRNNLPLRGWRCYPRAEEKIPITVHKIKQTRLFPPAGTDGKGYILADCAGESFSEGLVVNNDLSTGIDGCLPLNDRYLAVLTCASAYILVIRSDFLTKRDYFTRSGAQSTQEETAQAEADRKKVETMMKTFDRIVDVIAVTQKHLKEGRTPKKILETGVTAEEIKDMVFTNTLTTRPLAVAFSLADKLPEENPPLDLDPYYSTFLRFNHLHSSIYKSFKYYKLDFLSSFWGHKIPGDSPDYGLPSYGALSLFEWIRETLEFEKVQQGCSWPRRQFRQLRSGIYPTKHAVKMRLRIDGKFRRRWNERKNNG